MKRGELEQFALRWILDCPRWQGANHPETFAREHDADVASLLALLVRVRDEALEAAARECDGERMACERHARVYPKAVPHAVGIQIADVCARRVRGLKDES